MTDAPITPEAVEHFTATAMEGRAMTDALGIGQDPDGRYWAGEDGEFKIGSLFKNADGCIGEPYMVQTFFGTDGKVVGIDLPDTAKQALTDLSADLVRAALERARDACEFHDDKAAIYLLAADPEAVAAIVATVMGDKP